MIAPLPDDKRGHFITGALITFDVAIWLSLLHAGPALGLVLGLFVGLCACHVAAIGKELYDDSRAGHSAEQMDSIATIAGGSIVAVVLLLVIVALWAHGVR